MDSPLQGYTVDIKRVVSEALQNQLNVHQGNTQSSHPYVNRTYYNFQPLNKLPDNPYVNRTYYNFQPLNKLPDTESDLNRTSLNNNSSAIFPSDSSRLSIPMYWNIEDLEHFKSNQRPLPLPKNSEYCVKAASPRNNFFKFQRLNPDRDSSTSINSNIQGQTTKWKKIRKVLLAAIITAVVITCILLMFIVLLAVGIIGPGNNSTPHVTSDVPVVATETVLHTYNPKFDRLYSELSTAGRTTSNDPNNSSLQAAISPVFQPTEFQQVTYPRIVIGNDQEDTIQWVQ